MKLPVLFSEVPNKRPPMFIFWGESNNPLPLLRSLLGPSLFYTETRTTSIYQILDQTCVFIFL